MAICTYFIAKYHSVSQVSKSNSVLNASALWLDPALKKIPCTSNVAAEFSLECGVLTTDLSQGRFELSFAVLKLKADKLASKHLEGNGSRQKPAPVIYLEGGPGVGGVSEQTNIDFWQVFLKDAVMPREVVLLNTRGTKGSLPYFECEDLASEQLRFLTTSISPSEEIALMSGMQQQCAASYHTFLQAKVPYTTNQLHPGIGLLSSHYAKRDVTQLMRALGHAQWHVWGGSYGGRLALLAGHSEEVLSVILDSPYLFQSGNLLSFPRLELMARKNHIQLYRQFLNKLESKDAEVFPSSYLQLTQAVLSKLKSAVEPLEIALHDQPIEKIVFTELDLLSIEFTVLYDSALWESYYWFLLGLLTEDVPFSEEFSSQFDTKLVLDTYLDTFATESFNLATYTAVECLDNDLPDSTLFNQELALVAEEYFPNTMYASNETRSADITMWKKLWLEFKHSYVCNNGIFEARNSVHTAPYPSVPLLVLAGDKDPVTPAATLTELPLRDNVHSLVIPGWGHGVLLSYGCAPTMLTKALSAFEAGESIDPKLLCDSDYVDR